MDAGRAAAENSIHVVGHAVPNEVKRGHGIANDYTVKIVVFGLSISSSWGNGHATVWRGLCRELIARHHCFVFFEKDVPYYAEHRDLPSIEGGSLRLYSEW